MRTLKIFLLLFAVSVTIVRATDDTPAARAFLDVTQATDGITLLRTYLQALLLAIDPISEPEIPTQALIPAIEAAYIKIEKAIEASIHSEEESKILENLVVALPWCNSIYCYFLLKIEVLRQTIPLSTFFDRLITLLSGSTELPIKEKIALLKTTFKELYASYIKNHTAITESVSPEVKEIHSIWLHLVRLITTDLQSIFTKAYVPKTPEQIVMNMCSLISHGPDAPPFFIQSAPPRTVQHPVIVGITKQLINYGEERKALYPTTTTTRIVAILKELLAEMRTETFITELNSEQIDLLHTATGYKRCAITLASARNSIATAMKEEISYTDAELKEPPFQVRKATLIDPCDSKAFTTSAGVLKLSDFRGRLFNIHSM